MTTQWWSAPPRQQVCYFATDFELLGIALDPLPADAPAVVRFRPSTTDSFDEQIRFLLTELERAAMALFPSWLPGAEQLEISGALGAAAVRAMASQAARRSQHFGPFLRDLAERSWQRRGVGSPFPPAVRAVGLARVIADAYGRESAAILMAIPTDLTPTGEQSFVGAAEWLAQHGKFDVWLAGNPLRSVDRVRTVAVALPGYLRVLAETVAVPVEPAIAGASPVVQFPPPSGKPRPDSPAELALERALALQPWAYGRKWNYTYEATHLTRQFRLDLYWAQERVVVEVDGSDHREPHKWVDDRDRDVYLQMYGHNVLRFPNEVVLADVQLVVQKIHHMVSRRRDGARIPEMRHHADR